MAAGQQQKSGWGTFFFGLAVLGIAVTIGLIPLQHMENTYTHLRESTQYLLGEAETDVYNDSYSPLPDDAASAIASMSQDMGSKQPVSAWMNGRIAVLLLWWNIVSYRISSFFVWLISLLPFIAAACVDAVFVREIRKTEFFSQSPIRHAFGVKVAIGGMAITVAAMILPTNISPLITPFALLGFAVAAWLWISNLQKRL